MPPETTPIVVGGHAFPITDRDPPVVSLEDRPVIDRVAVAATRATRTDPIVTARTATHAERLEGAVSGVTPARIRVPDDTPAQAGGLTSAVAAGLEAVDTPWTFICGSDMPQLSPRAIRLLGERAERLSPAGVVPLSDGRPEPLHGMYRTADLKRELENACASTTLRGVVERLSPLVTVPATHADDALRRSLEGIERVEEHETLLGTDPVSSNR